MPLAEGTRLDRYQVLSPIGAGGMGEVYLAQDTRLGRKVAIKLLPPHYTQDPERLRRFEQEAFAASSLNHPNIITIYEIGEADGRHFIVTEFIEGQTLRRRLATGRIPANEALEMASQIASALATAHNAGIIHRDIKPENLMIRPDGYVKILDFGLAKLTEKMVNTELFENQIDSEEFRTHVGVEGEPDETSPVEIGEALRGTVGASPAGETVPGIVMGTAQYMSPEQARGLRVDWRTDIFSFGIVLYEMLAGRAPFSGNSTKEIIAAILQTDPSPLSRYLPEATESLEWIVSKALVKDREERYQTAKEMLNDFKRLQRRLEVEQEISRTRSSQDKAATRSNPGQETRLSGNTTQELSINTGVISNAQSSGLFAHLSGNGQRKRFANPTFITLAAVTLLAVSFSLYQFISSRATTNSPFQSMQVRRFTSSGKVTRAVISPDGKYVVHVLSNLGKQSLLVRQVTPSDNVEVVAPGEVTYRGLTFSRDGTHVYYVLQERNDPISSLYQVPVLGGAPRRILRDIDSPVAISPDGKQLAFLRRVRGQGEDQLLLANADGGNIHVLVSRKGADFFSISGPAWSPDGKRVACFAGSNTGGRHTYLAEFNVANGQDKLISSLNWSNVGRVWWLRDGRGLVATAAEQGSPLAQVWFYPYPSGTPRKITNDLNDYRDASVTDDARALATIQSEANVNVWLLPSGNNSNDSLRARQITEGVGHRSGDRGLTWLPNGKLIYISRASGSQDIWMMDQNGKSQQQLTTPETRAETYPAVSPDGRYVAFSSNRTGNSNIYRLDINSGDQLQLTKGPSEEFPAISADGKWVIYTATSSSKFTLWKVPIDGGQPVQLTDRLSSWPTICPDGQHIACWYRQESNAPWQIAILSINGGEPEKIMDVPATADPNIPIRWMPDGASISYVDMRNGVSNLWAKPIDGGDPRQLTQFSTDLILWFDWSRDGKQLACSRGKINNDIVLVSEFK